MVMRPCWVEISARALEDNYRFLADCAAPHAELMPIVKADAYGHGLAQCAPAAVDAGARWLGVTSVEEGAKARGICQEPHIVVLSGVFPGQGPEIVERELTSVVWEEWQLAEIETAARRANRAPGTVPVHLEIDTGMSRQGVQPSRLGAFLRRFPPESPLRLEAVMTHLFAADEAGGEATSSQLNELAGALDGVRACGLKPEWLSVGNSAALLSGQAPAIARLATKHGMRALMRPGLALYGLVPRFDPDYRETEPENLRVGHERLLPVLSWKTRVVGVRTVAPGTVIGYNGTFVATEPMRLALLAVGYADGLDRRLGNRFSLLVRGQRAPLVGRVSMDQAVLDITEIPGVAPDDEVVILGKQGSDSISALDHAEACGTIPWEVFTRIGSRVMRVTV